MASLISTQIWKFEKLDSWGFCVQKKNVYRTAIYKTYTTMAQICISYHLATTFFCLGHTTFYKTLILVHPLRTQSKGNILNNATCAISKANGKLISLWILVVLKTCAFLKKME